MLAMEDGALKPALEDDEQAQAGDLLLLTGLAGLGDSSAVQDEEDAVGRPQAGLERPGHDKQPATRLWSRSAGSPGLLA